MYKYFKELCGKEREVPWTVPAFYATEVFDVFDEAALPVMLAYTAMLEHTFWIASGMIYSFSICTYQNNLVGDIMTEMSAKSSRKTHKFFKKFLTPVAFP